MTLLERPDVETFTSEESPFLRRHIGPSPADRERMLQLLGHAHLEDFVAAVVPQDILEDHPPKHSLPSGVGEAEALGELHDMACQNKVYRSLIGLGYHATSTPAVIQRHVFENPGWYTAYTPYQAEISQGRLEALLNFQTLITELTGLSIANASLLDEGTAAAEAMSLSLAVCKRPEAKRFLVDADVLPQTLAILQTRAEPLGVEIGVFQPESLDLDSNVFGVLLQLPGRSGRLWDPTQLCQVCHQAGILVTVAIDPLAQVLMAPVGSLGADIAIGSAQRFGVPMAFGGPHAAFFATREDFKRQIPGRLVGQSLDAEGRPALRLALQTREQHIRRDKATSNICTSQVLLAVMASFYAVHHGPDGLKEIAARVIQHMRMLEHGLAQLGFQAEAEPRFDTIEILTAKAPAIHQAANRAGFNLRVLPINSDPENVNGFGISLDELTTQKEVLDILSFVADALGQPAPQPELPGNGVQQDWPGIPLRSRAFLKQAVFHQHHSETDLLRYIQTLVSKDFSLVHGMIPLGSCTMKLNAAAELIPVSWRRFSCLHPFIPAEQSIGYQRLIDDLESWLSALTGFAGVSLQPNAGSQGEYAGLLVIRAWHRSRGDDHRDVCLIPTSAHGTNPASAVMAGLRVVTVACDQDGNVDVEDLKAKAELHASKLAALMITYPSTHGVFEPAIRRICRIVHDYGGQVYLDGANLNAQVGLCRPGNYGADVCHLNLHKTFCIPHGGGGPGVGPIGVADHLLPFLPRHPLTACGGVSGIGAVSAAGWGSAGILPISWMYLRMMGAEGMRQASAMALLAANYVAYRLSPHYPILFRGEQGLVAHECILDLRPLKRTAGLEVDDIAKRLMDYGFHAPTISWPVAGTLMVEPTESESLDELNRFCEAMIAIRAEADAIESGRSEKDNNPLKAAPHTLAAVTADVWDRPYTRQQAAFPMPDQLNRKFWPSVARVNNAFGDRNLICSCPSPEDFED